MQPERGTVYTAYLVKAEFEEAKFISVSDTLRIWGHRKGSVMESDVLSSHGPNTLATKIVLLTPLPLSPRSPSTSFSFPCGCV